MATDLTPYLSITDFSAMFTARQLTDGEVMLAQLLLEAAALFIRNAFDADGLDAPPVTDPMARLVSFQVVRDALAVPADLAGHTSYQRMSDDRSEGGTLLAAGDLLDFTENHRRLLGLSLAAAPKGGGFTGFPPLHPPIRYITTPAGPVVVGDVLVDSDYMGEVVIGGNWVGP